MVMVKRKVIIIANVDETQSPAGIKYAMDQAFSNDTLNVDVVYFTSFNEGEQYSLTAMAIEDDIENTLENNNIEATRERIVKLSNYVATSDDLSEEIGFAIDRGFDSLNKDGEL